MVNENEFFVMLENEWFYKKEEDKEVETLLEKYNSDGLMIYSILLRDLTIRNTIKFSMNDLYTTLLIDKNKNTRMVNKIKDTIKKLNNELFIIYVDSECKNKLELNNIDNNTTYYAKLKREPLKNNYFIVYDFEVSKLIKYAIDNKNKNKEDLISHYCFLAKSFNNNKEDENYGVCYPKLETITNRIQLSESTLLSNNEIFKDLKLLLIDNTGGNIEDGKYKNTSNIYARLGYEEQFNKALKSSREKISKKYDKLNTKAQQDQQRKLKQLCNTYKKQNNIINMDDLDDEQFEELNQLELTYYNFVVGRGKKPTNPHFITIKRDGTIKERYIQEDEEDELDKYEDNIENESIITKGKGLYINGEKLNNSKNLDEEAPNEFNDDETKRKELIKYIKEQYKLLDKNTQRNFVNEFEKIKFKEIKGKEISDVYILVKEFFTEAQKQRELDAYRKDNNIIEEDVFSGFTKKQKDEEDKVIHKKCAYSK